MEQENNNVKEVTEKPFSEHLAMEMLKNEREKSKAKNGGVIGLTIGIVCLSIATVVIVVHLTNINYKNDMDWRELFGSYDYVSQDGNGQNYYNSDIGGNVNNGAESKETEK